MTNFVLEDSRRTKLLVVVIIIIMILGTILNGFSYFAFIYPTKYPPSKLVTSAFIWHVATRFMVSWYPFSFFLIHWRKHGNWTICSFVIGCTIGMCLSFASVIMLDGYKSSPTRIQDEYVNATRKYLAEKNELPTWIYYDEENKCCTWPGYIEFKNNSVPTNPKLVNELIECYKATEILKGSSLEGKKKFLNETTDVANKNCDSFRDSWIKNQHKLIFISAVITSFFGAFSIVLFIHYYLEYVEEPFVQKLKKRAAADEQTRAETERTE